MGFQLGLSHKAPSVVFMVVEWPAGPRGYLPFSPFGQGGYGGFYHHTFI